MVCFEIKQYFICFCGVMRRIDDAMYRTGIFECDSRLPWSFGKTCCILFIVEFFFNADFGLLGVPVLCGRYADETWCITAAEFVRMTVDV